MLTRDGLPVIEVSMNVAVLLCRVDQWDGEVEDAPEGSTNLVTLQNVSVTRLGTTMAVRSRDMLTGGKGQPLTH